MFSYTYGLMQLAVHMKCVQLAVNFYVHVSKLLLLSIQSHIDRPSYNYVPILHLRL